MSMAKVRFPENDLENFFENKKDMKLIFKKTSGSRSCSLNKVISFLGK